MQVRLEHINVICKKNSRCVGHETFYFLVTSRDDATVPATAFSPPEYKCMTVGMNILMACELKQSTSF